MLLKTVKRLHSLNKSSVSATPLRFGFFQPLAMASSFSSRAGFQMKPLNNYEHLQGVQTLELKKIRFFPKLRAERRSAQDEKASSSDRNDKEKRKAGKGQS